MALTKIFMYIVTALLCTSNATPSDFDCPMRQLLLEYSVEINPSLTQRQLQDTADALNGSPRGVFYGCNVKPPSIHNTTFIKPKYDPPSSTKTIYVDAKSGDDNINTGLSLSSPLKTLQKAISTARKLFGPTNFKQILLRQGTYYIQQTIKLNHLDSNLLLKPYKDENVNISGAVPLNNLNWRQYGTKNGNKVFYTTIDTNANIFNFAGLRINGYRGIRARYPNVESEETFPPETYNLNPKQWLTVNSAPTQHYVYNVSKFVRNDTNPVVPFMPGGYQYYNLEMGDSWQNKFLPPAFPPRFSYLYIDGLVYNKQILPNAPYKDPSGGIVRAFMQLHWNSWMWEIDPQRTTDTQLHFKYDGGVQGSQGMILN